MLHSARLPVLAGFDVHSNPVQTGCCRCQNDMIRYQSLKTLYKNGFAGNFFAEGNAVNPKKTEVTTGCP